MKKQAKKLNLSKETLRTLGENGMREVAGGAPSVYIALLLSL